MNISRTLNNNCLPQLQAHSKKSLLTLAIIASIVSVSNAYAEQLDCGGASMLCSDNLNGLGTSFGSSSRFTNAISTAVDTDRNTNSKSGNTINADLTNSADISYVFGSYHSINIDNTNHLAEAGGNTISVKNGALKRNVYGSFASTATTVSSTGIGEAKVDGNNTTLENVNVTDKGFGGHAVSIDSYGTTVAKAQANGNIFTLKDSTFNHELYGGYASSGSAGTETFGTANENTLDIFGAVSSYSNIYGGYAEALSASMANDADPASTTVVKNVVNIDGNGGIFNKETIYGGYAKSEAQKYAYYSGSSITDSTAKVEENTVTLSNGSFEKDIYGGYANVLQGQATVRKNEVKINQESDISGNITGGENTVIGDVSGNKVYLNNDTNILPVKGIMVYGGKGKSITNENEVHANAKGTYKLIIGGQAQHSSSIDGAKIDTVTASNRIVFENGTVATLLAGYSSSNGRSNNAESTTNSMRNNIVISGGHITSDARAGIAHASAKKGTSNAFATENNITIDNAIFKTNNGRANEVYGGYSLAGNTAAANKNIVTINSGEFESKIYGGYSAINGGQSAEAKENTVLINGGEIASEVYGGYAKDELRGNPEPVAAADVNATNNTITIKGNPTFVTGTNLFGGFAQNGITNDAFTGNTLNLHIKDITVSDVKNFENYNFYLSNDVGKDSTMLKLTSTDATDLSTSKYGVGVKTGTTSLPQGYTVTLIESATTLTLSSTNPANDITNMTDIVSGYEFRLSVKDGNKLVAELPYTVTIENSDPSKGSVSNTGEKAYQGETITFEVSPNNGYKASISSIASSKCTPMGSWNGNTYTSSEITSECTITVDWEEINYTIGGTVNGLNGSVTLQNNTGNDLILNVNGEFIFTTTAVHGEDYSVTVSSQPAGQECSVDNGSGTISDSNISDITVTCSEEINYNIGGTVSGLNGSVTLQNNAGNDLTLNADGVFTFTTTAPHGEDYSVTVSTQPTGQKCTVDNGSGTISDSNISDITVTCSDVITIGTIFSDSFE